MSRLILAIELLVNPDHQMFGIADSAPDRDLRTPQPLDSPDGWLGRGESEVLVRTGQDHAQVTLRFESWDAEPPTADETPELSGTAHLLMPTGEVEVNLIAAGVEPTEFSLPESGTYNVRIDAYGRDKTENDVVAVLDRFIDDPDPPFEEELGRLAGQEHYTIRFWPANL